MATPNRLQPPPPPPTPALDAFIRDLAALAKKHRVTTLVIAGVDPPTQQSRLYGDPNSIAVLRGIVAEKMGLFDGGETGWEA